MQNSEKIIHKLEQHDTQFKKIDKRFDEHDKRFDKIERILFKHDSRLDRIEETMATKDDLAKLQDRVLTGQDKMMVILQRLDQERIFTQEWIRRIEKEVESHTKELTKVKQILKIA